MQHLQITKPLTVINLISAIRCSAPKSKAVLVIVSLTGLMSFISLAEGREQHEAHTHGVANLSLVSENGALEVHFESAAMSLFGFEHEPKTRNQIEAIEKVQALLNSPTKVMYLKGSDCASESVSVDILGPAGRVRKNSHEHASVHNHDDSKEKNTNHNHSSDSHSEVSATYVFKCTNGDDLRSIKVHLFEHFSDLEKVMVNWVTETEQKRVVLRPESPIIEIR